MGEPTTVSPIMPIYIFILKSLVSRRNCYVWTGGVSSRMLVVESDEAVTEKSCLFCEQHGEGGKRGLLVNRCRCHWSHWRNSGVPVSSCAQGLALPAGARLQEFLAEDLRNSRTDFVFCSCDPPSSGRTVFKNVISSAVLTDLFLRLSPATKASILLPKASIGARKYIFSP